jgi:hypothetical protein
VAGGCLAELDANKNAPGRKRGLTVDVLGLIIVVVLAASAQDNTASITLPDLAAERCRNRLERALADQAFKDEVIRGALLDITDEVVRRNPVG